MENPSKEEPVSTSEQQQMLPYNKPQHKYRENEISRYIEGDILKKKKRFVFKFDKQKLKSQKVWILTDIQISKSKWFLNVTLPSLLILISLVCGIVICGVWFISPTKYVYLTYFEQGKEDHTTTIQVDFS